MCPFIDDKIGSEKKRISGISISGYKSIINNIDIEITNLTILAGANSSGKTSIMQPILLMKQTLDEVYDPGDLLIDGPHVKFNSADNFLSKFEKTRKNKFTVKIEFDEGSSIRSSFKKGTDKPVELVETEYLKDNYKFLLKYDMSEAYLMQKYPAIKDMYSLFSESVLNAFRNQTISSSGNYLKNDIKIGLTIRRRRCFLSLTIDSKDKNNMVISQQYLPILGFENLEFIEKYISEIIHVPALRCNPERTYKTAAVGPRFPGTIDNYTASIINHWKISKDERIKIINRWLTGLGLTSKVDTNKISDTQVEILVHRLTITDQDSNDMVNIADVGFGVAQTLPILVALLIAEKDQIVYIEQPEIHLHPRAQYVLAEILIEAANKGVKVIIETHSILLLTGIQTLIAEGKISPDLIKLHWFSREVTGITNVTSTNFDKQGAFGDCPVDFAEISLTADSRYLDATDS